MDSFYLICFIVGLVLSLLSVVGGFAHLHIGRLHFGHVHTHGAAHKGGLSAVNGFTITAFLTWFGGIGYLLHHYSIFTAPLILLLAIAQRHSRSRITLGSPLQAPAPPRARPHL